MNDSFCGWYFKCQSKGQTLAVIPSVHAAGGNRWACIQIISNDGNWAAQLPYEHVLARREGPCAIMDGNVFSSRGFRLDLHADGLSAEGFVRFGPLSPIRYDIMGPFRYVPFMECRHSVYSMRHRVNGRLRVNGTDYNFQNGVGYLEGDRGRSFPNHYVWTQCCFPGGSLMLSAAEIPLGPGRFTGVIGVVQLEGKEYRLATYLGAKVAGIGGNKITVRQGGLVFTASLLEKKAFSLQAPVAGAMGRMIKENVSCRACYRFSKNGRTLLDFETQNASFEYEYPC